MSFLKTKMASIALFILALVLFFAGTFQLSNPDISYALSGLLGFSGIAAFRLYIESHGWKTYVVAVGGIISILLVKFGILPAGQFNNIMAFFLSLAGMTLAEGYSKTITARSLPKIINK